MKKVYIILPTYNDWKSLNKVLKILDFNLKKQNKEIENEIKKYGRVGVPLNILLRPGQVPFIFSEWLDKEEIVQLLID